MLVQTTRARTDEDIVKLHVQPTVVILSMRVDEIVEQYFDPDGRSRASLNGESKDLERHVILQLTLYVL